MASSYRYPPSMAPPYLFSSEPRAAASGHYRTDESAPMNLMYDHRVFRGSTYGKYRAGAGGESKTNREEAGGPGAGDGLDNNKWKRKPRKVKNIYSYKAPKTERKEVNLAAYLVEHKPEPVTADVPSQTVGADSWVPLPPFENYVPTKTGVDCATQVDTEEIFDFDFEVQPLLDVLVWKTLEAAQVEVEEEEEMRSLVERRNELEDLIKEEANRVGLMERMEIEKRKDADERMRVERDRVNRERQLNSKLKSRAAAQAMLHGVIDDTFKALRDCGYFVRPVVQEVEKLFIPSLLRNAAHLVSIRTTAAKLTTHLIERATNIRAATAQAKRKEIDRARKKGVIRIRLSENSIFGAQEIGPIPITIADDVVTVEEKIRQWLRDNIEELEEESLPQEGFLDLLFNGESLERGKPLLDIGIPDDATQSNPTEVEAVLPPPAAAEGEGEGDGEMEHGEAEGDGGADEGGAGAEGEQ